MLNLPYVPTLTSIHDYWKNHRFDYTDLCWQSDVSAFYTCLGLGLPYSSDGKESVCNAEDQGSIPRSVRSPGEWNGNPLQYSCLENPMDKGAWQATVHEVTKG